VAIKAALARELAAQPGDEVLIQFERQGEVPRATLLGESDPTATLRSLRLTVTAVLPDQGVGRFSLAANQALPLNAFVELDLLQRRLERPGEINAVLLASDDGPRGPEPADQAAAGRRLREAMTLADVGLRFQPGDGWLALESREFVLRPPVAQAALEVATEQGRATLPILTYLANRMETAERLLPYSTVTALPWPVPGGLGEWQPEATGEPRADWPDLPPVVLNRWAADELGAAPGDRVRMTYFEVGATDELTTTEAEFQVTGVLPMSGVGADRALTPDFPGIADAERISDWDPPFPVDLGLVRPADEEYWRRWRGAPKAFVPLETGQKLWRSRFGALTAIRIGLLPGEEIGEAGEAIAAALKHKLPPAALGLALLPVREQGLAAASGTTSFGGLFVGFSLFLIVSSALLVALLFRLGTERRAGELGLRQAAGFPLRAVRRMLLAEGAVLAVVGGLLGIGLAALYGRAVLAGLSTWWAPILSSPFLRVELRPASLATGFLISLVVVLGSIALTLRRLRRLPVRALLAGVVEESSSAGRSRGLARWLAPAALLSALALLAIAFGSGEPSPALFFGVGAALLTAGFAAFALWCRGGFAKGDSGRLTMAGTVARNSARNPGRSLLSVVLVGSACFVLVAVAANRREAGSDALRRDSGTGGFTLVAESDVPLARGLSDGQALAELGFSEENREQLAEISTHALRLRPGEDASCLNLYQPERPRLLGVPPEFIERGGFSFRATATAAEEPWRLLEQPLEPGVIPAIGDANSVQWILHLGIGDELEMEDDRGRPLRLRIVGTLDTSIFQSELLIPEAAFLEHFPDSAGFAYFLAETPPELIEPVGRMLEEGLSRYGFDATPAAEKLEAYMAVEHMYLDTFQALGGLGLLLGTLGLAVVLARNVIERRSELATLRAFGFRRRSLAWLVVGENGFLLVTGITVGAAAGLVAVAPHLSGHLPWRTLIGTLAVVFVVGIGAGALAVAAALRTPLLPALKAER
jgi:ABC-type lipoprotein release transport system permease subunit